MPEVGLGASIEETLSTSLASLSASLPESVGSPVKSDVRFESLGSS